MSTSFASQNLTVGQLNAIVKRLGGEEGAMRFLRGETIVRERRATDYQLFCTLDLGTGIKDADGFCEAIKVAKMRTSSDPGNNILGNPAFTVANSPRKVDLVVVSVKDLGFTKGATRQEIYDRAIELGLELCPAEVGPKLRLQYADQPKGEGLLIGMQPIADSADSFSLFNVAHNDDGLLLVSYSDYPAYIWDAQRLWIFVRPRV